jgi:hypothetical protein
LKDIEPVLNELETSENQKKIMNSDDISEGSTEGELYHYCYSHLGVFETMSKYVCILTFSL